MIAYKEVQRLKLEMTIPLHIKGAISINVDKAIFSKASVVTQLLTMRMDQTLCTRYER